MALQDEIQAKAREIFTDSYPMSIGELVNLYKDGEIIINPEFQRFFRWDIQQKSRLIESILLGIPIPPIFVSQGNGGKWDVIDGQQRLSTIFQFMGILKDEEGKVKEAESLQETTFLPSLAGKKWDSQDENSLTSEQRIEIKRAKFNIIIIKANSHNAVKYDLFQRLNTGGTPLSSQEVRNCLLIMLNKTFYTSLTELNNHTSFKNCIPLSENDIAEQADMEYIIRFIIARHSNLEGVVSKYSIHDFLTSEISRYATDGNFNINEEKSIFKKTFDLLDAAVGEEVFRRYSSEKQRFQGPVLSSSFEVLIPGLTKYLDNVISKSINIKDLIIELHQKDELRDATKPGSRALDRFCKLKNLSLNFFKDKLE